MILLNQHRDFGGRDKVNRLATEARAPHHRCMPSRSLETDYLVIGAGAAGLAFTDSLITESDAEVIVVDRRATPGGHWNDAYPFVQLHQPSLYYGVNSMPLGPEAIQTSGREAGMYGRASGAEIREYFGRVMNERLVKSGRVRFFPECNSDGGRRFESMVSGDTYDVSVRKRIVNATYLSPSIPANSPPPFDVADGVACVPVNAIANLASQPERFVIIGGGKTAMDACVWLLEQGVSADRIQWIKPRDSWIRNRRFSQAGELVGTLLDGVASQMEAAAHAESEEDLFVRLEGARSVPPGGQERAGHDVQVGDDRRLGTRAAARHHERRAARPRDAHRAEPHCARARRSANEANASPRALRRRRTPAAARGADLRE